MGVVYLALDSHLDRRVVIKVLSPNALTNAERKRRFIQEAKAASALSHPNIVIIHDTDTADGIDFIVMEYVPGKSLDRLIGRKGLGLREALHYSIQVADALSAAHRAGIVHRDLKPANIMVSDSGHIKLLDFGLAKLTEPLETDEQMATRTMNSEEQPCTEEGTIVGTVNYMSPEQAQGKRVDARSDIFSFGSVLYEMVTGRRAFQGDSKLATLSAILNQEPVLLGAASEMPRDVGKIVTRCLRKDAARRFQDTDDLKIALEELREESQSGAVASGRPTLGSRTLPLALVAFVVLAVAVVLWLARSRIAPPEEPLSAFLSRPIRVANPIQASPPMVTRSPLPGTAKTKT
jgi:serine/threonine protein kinase